MNAEEIREYCLNKQKVTESFPFNETTLVFKVAGKMFALLSLDSTDLSINLKCEPERAVRLREKYPAVQPGYHMNKQHWNTVYVNETIPRKEILQFIDDSYNLIVSKLPKKIKNELNL